MKIINIKGTRSEKCNFDVKSISMKSEDDFTNFIKISDHQVCSEFNFNIHHEEPEYDYRIDEYEVVDEERGNYKWPAARDGEAVTISIWTKISAAHFINMGNAGGEDLFQATDDEGLIRHYRYETICFEPEVGEQLSDLLDDYVDEARANQACRLEIVESPYLEGTYWKFVRKPVTSE